MTATQIIAFAGIVQLAAMSPGPDFAVVVRRSVASGTRGGMATALGVGTGVFVWATSAAMGVAALLAASAAAFTVVKILGAAYLVFLGIRLLRAAIGDEGEPAIAEEGKAPATAWRSFRQGLLCNVLNPKAAAFFVALMPQFVGGRPEVGATVVLALVAVAVTIGWFLTVAVLVGALRRVLARPVVRRGVDAVTGVALIGLGARLAATSRP